MSMCAELCRSAYILIPKYDIEPAQISINVGLGRHGSNNWGLVEPK